jgi:putative endopeptidase
MQKLRKPVDRTEWHMTPQTVNAYCNFGLNEIVFPAAILQWPFFDLRADDAVNYAGIGTVIGHEMTHGFDDQGSKFDAKGNMRSWWSAADRKKFMAKAKLLVEQYNEYGVGGDVTVNGQLTLGENIADLGGLAIGWDAYQKRLKKTGRKVIDGLSPEERFFLGFAQMERELARPEFTRMHALSDPHSPAFSRINGPLANFAPFFEQFTVTKKDKLYRNPKKRAEVW